MAGALLERELKHSARIRFSVATRDDDAEIRALLRNNPMAGRISISLEREPSYFIDIPGETKTTIIARDGAKLACVGSCAFRPRFINAQPRRVGYLGALRIDAPYAGRFDILRRGYEFFREQQSENRADFYFTSIASDNNHARNFLERGLRGMPTYEFIGDFVTLVIPTKRFRPIEFGPEGPYQLEPCKKNFPTPIWDQRHFKQTVIRKYSTWLALLRPLLNLPAVGETLSSAFVTSPHANVHEAGVQFLTLGFASNDPRLQHFRRNCKPRKYHSRLYIVRWPGLGAAASELDGRILNPEVALL